MDDQRPISGAEKAFFSLGTGRGTFFFCFVESADILNFPSACCGHLHQV
jgi:hypothetical protein